jgi:hypothetical protein
MNQIMNEAEFLDYRRRDNEWIEVALAHGAAQAIDRENEWKPGFENLLDGA